MYGIYVYVRCCHCSTTTYSYLFDAANFTGLFRESSMTADTRIIQPPDS